MVTLPDQLVADKPTKKAVRTQIFSQEDQKGTREVGRQGQASLAPRFLGL
jgi:hypothetical protein